MGRLSKGDCLHPCRVGIISLGEDLMRTKRQRKREFAALLELGPIFSCPPPAPESRAFRPELGLRPLASPSSQAFEFVLDLPTSFPGPPACRPQIVDFSVSVIMSIPRINLLPTALHISCWFRFSEQPTNTGPKISY